MEDRVNISLQSYHHFSSHQSTSSWEWRINHCFPSFLLTKTQHIFLCIQSFGKEKPEASQISHMVFQPNLLYVLAFWLGIFNLENETFWLVNPSMWLTGEISSVLLPSKWQEHCMHYSSSRVASGWQAKDTSGLACGKQAHWINVIAHAHSAVGSSRRIWLMNCDNSENWVSAL